MDVNDDVSEVWAAAAQKAKAKERKLSAKERKANMPRLRFRLRQYEKYPRLNVSDGGAVTNFSGLSLQATNPYGFVWDTVYKRRERQITCSEDNAMGLLQLYDSLSSLKERHHFQSGGRTAGPLAAVLENVQFTDRMDLVRETGQEWAWIQAAPGSARTPGAASLPTAGTPLMPISSPSRALTRTDSGRNRGLEHNLSSGSNGGLGQNMSNTGSLRDSGGGGGSRPGHRRVRSESYGSDGAFDQVANPLAYAHHSSHHSAQPLRTGGLPLPGTAPNVWPPPLARDGHSVESGSSGDEEPMPLPFHIATADPSEHNGFTPLGGGPRFGSMGLDNQMEAEEGGPESTGPSLADNIRRLRASEDDDKGMAHVNPLARSPESDASVAPLFTMGAVMDGGNGSGGSGDFVDFGFDKVDHAELPQTGGRDGLRHRPAPLFMAAVEDEDDLDGSGGGREEVRRGSNDGSVGGAGGGSSGLAAPRASAAVFEQEEDYSRQVGIEEYSRTGGSKFETEEDL